jgi:argininosuccinate lyase
MGAKEQMKNNKLWSGRFSQGMAKSVEDFTSSIAVDGRMFKEDICGSIAWANALKKAKVITAAETAKITKGLNAILAGLEKGTIKLKDELEDVHMNIESLLTSKIGEVGKKLHTGRSRNDQVVTDLRMYSKKEICSVVCLIQELKDTIVDIAEANISVIIPGYTHLQQAQPVLLSHHLMAYYEMFSRDEDRLADALKRVDVMPLGSGALAGSAYPIDRASLAKELGFSKVSLNSMDAVSDRDFVAEVIFALTLVMTHLSRFCSELVLWSSSEYKFISIGDAFTTGSSIMPQKKNPDVAELIRGKTSHLLGYIVSALTLIKGLPLTYNRDFQEDKGPLFAAFDTTSASLKVFSQMLGTIKFNSLKMRKMFESSILATDLADYLVNKGMAFRNAHEAAGKVVAYCEKQSKDLRILSLSEFRMFCPVAGNDLYDVLTLESSINKRDILGGTATAQVKRAIAQAKKGR